MNKQRLLARSRKRRSPGSVIGQVGAAKHAVGADDGEASDVDPEIYDDFDFYTSQLEKVGVLCRLVRLMYEGCHHVSMTNPLL